MRRVKLAQRQCIDVNFALRNERHLGAVQKLIGSSMVTMCPLRDPLMQSITRRAWSIS